MFSSFFSRFSVCFSSFVKLLSVIEAVCRVEATLLLMLSLVAAVILPTDKKDYHDKMNELVNDKQTYQELKHSVPGAPIAKYTLPEPLFNLQCYNQILLCQGDTFRSRLSLF